MTEPQEGILKDGICYRVAGAALGGFTEAIGISGIKGIEFVMPALLLVFIAFSVLWLIKKQNKNKLWINVPI